ncbi:Protein of unknown function (DUF3343) [Sphaerochaeta pleomorpha str. Grapes]|uniref:Putative Se/S carrier protein-like domain-containing protein n=1 Tax=Sphaerochaeta pleomorpha (strain ATCC BAA-1885 / DSM 22778 / Grapes) TaxID=158190 RepID=G8QT46_SPHPG|nr:DUF3343 domain-containing protein [Sphaerochaeta pleomorpha]AEV27951.1 Protein of unknown function (DUF3343) [Sphaerochaeta pleomorpha str. Grapes]
MLFIATFFTHFGAIKFREFAKKQNLECILMPVPRVLSSSCGTCARYKAEHWDIGFSDEALEGVFSLDKGDGYEQLFKAKE